MKSPFRVAVFAFILAGAWAVLFWKYGLALHFFVYGVLSAVLCLAAFIDFETSTIPNKLVVFLLALWVASVWFMPVFVGGSGFGFGSSFGLGVGNLFAEAIPFGNLAVAADGLLGALVVGGGVLLSVVVVEQITHKPALGGGDVKLLFAIALFLGLYASLVCLFLACVLGLVFAAIWRLQKKKVRTSYQGSAKGIEEEAEIGIAKGIAKGTEEDSRLGSSGGQPNYGFPFAPAIAVATFITLILSS